MDIQVTVEQPDLTTIIGQQYTDDAERAPLTLGDAVASKIVTRLADSGEWWDSLRKQVHDQREEIIREEVTPVILETIRGPIPRTNSYGEITGQTTTLRELIIAEVKRMLTVRASEFGGDAQLTLLQKTVRDAVAHQFGKEVTAAVLEARETMADGIAATVAAAVKAGMKAR